MKRAGLYVRVSTREQTVTNQELELRQWAAHLGFDVVRIFADVASGDRGDPGAAKQFPGSPCHLAGRNGRGVVNHAPDQPTDVAGSARWRVLVR